MRYIYIYIAFEGAQRRSPDEAMQGGTAANEVPGIERLVEEPVPAKSLTAMRVTAN